MKVVVTALVAVTIRNCGAASTSGTVAPAKYDIVVPPDSNFNVPPGGSIIEPKRRPELSNDIAEFVPTQRNISWLSVQKYPSDSSVLNDLAAQKVYKEGAEPRPVETEGFAEFRSPEGQEMWQQQLMNDIVNGETQNVDVGMLIARENLGDGPLKENVVMQPCAEGPLPSNFSIGTTARDSIVQNMGLSNEAIEKGLNTMQKLHESGVINNMMDAASQMKNIIDESDFESLFGQTSNLLLPISQQGLLGLPQIQYPFSLDGLVSTRRQLEVVADSMSESDIENLKVLVGNEYIKRQKKRQLEGVPATPTSTTGGTNPPLGYDLTPFDLDPTMVGDLVRKFSAFALAGKSALDLIGTRDTAGGAAGTATNGAQNAASQLSDVLGLVAKYTDMGANFIAPTTTPTPTPVEAARQGVSDIITGIMQAASKFRNSVSERVLEVENQDIADPMLKYYDRKHQLNRLLSALDVFVNRNVLSRL